MRGSRAVTRLARLLASSSNAQACQEGAIGVSVGRSAPAGCNGETFSGSTVALSSPLGQQYNASSSSWGRTGLFAAAGLAASALGCTTALADADKKKDSLYYHGGAKPDENPYMHPDPNQKRDAHGLLIVPGNKATAPNVPPPCNRNYPVHMIVDLTTTTETKNVSPLHKYTFWTFDGSVPGPLIRCRVGDVLEVRYTNKDKDGIGHNIDFHAATGPGGGAPVTYAEEGETKIATFKMLDPGLFIYHCAAAPVPTHVANGMYGLVLVEPEVPLPPVDKEFYVLQSEIYAEESSETKGLLDHSYADGLAEHPMYVVLNGAEGALTEQPLIADQGDHVRIYFGNAGPNLSSAFHVIGATFERVYREGDLISPPGRCIQTTLVPPGGSAVVDMHLQVPGNYTLLDHAIFRLDKGCVGFLKVRPKGPDRRRDIYDSVDPPANCPNCKLHN